MKMKKLVSYAFFTMVFLLGISATAQPIDTGKSASTTLKVNLANAYNIQIGQSSVTIDMNTANHFAQGNNSGTQQWHVVVSSNTGYEVKVAATTELLNGASSIPVNTITVKPQMGDYLGGGIATPPTDIILTNNDLAVGTQKTIISKNTGETKRGYNVEYLITPANAVTYMNKTPGSYITTVTYSLFSK